jgi:hypothetical protein
MPFPIPFLVAISARYNRRKTVATRVNWSARNSNLLLSTRMGTPDGDDMPSRPWIIELL